MFAEHPAGEHDESNVPHRNDGDGQYGLLHRRAEYEPEQHEGADGEISDQALPEQHFPTQRALVAQEGLAKLGGDEWKLLGDPRQRIGR